MFFILPIIFLLFLSVIGRRYFENWRVSILFAAIITATAITFITEGLSLVQSLSFYPLSFIWLMLTLAAGIKVFIRRSVLLWPNMNFKVFSLSDKLLFGIIVLICVISAITAAVGTPNTWDSMTYHLTRVEHWIQNKTVAYYPTNIIRQLYITPWAEFTMAQVKILGGNESSANFVQWAAMLGSLVSVSLIARQLGAGRRGQLIAVVLAACLPMGILESVSTQTDYVCAFWLTVFVFFLIEAKRRFSLINIFAAGLSLGLACLTKGNSYIFALPFLVWFITTSFKQSFSRGLLGLLLMIICVVGINMGQYIRNTQAFGSPAWTNVPLTNEVFDFKVLWENVLRNMSIHLATPFMGTNENMVDAITKATQWVGADINDPRASYNDNFDMRSMNFDEDYSGNFLHAILFMVVFILASFYRGLQGKIGFYVLCILSSFLLFCLIVRYQPFNSRFHLPLFILFCPVAGVVLEYFLKQGSVVLGILFFVGAIPWLFLNKEHPWLGMSSIWNTPKPAQYFYKRPVLALPYHVTAAYLKSLDCRQIGLFNKENDWEYPWWSLLDDKGVRIEDVNVSNPSASLKYPLGDFQPCVIIVTGTQPPPFVMIDNAIYGPDSAVPAGDTKITIFLKLKS